MRPVEPGGHGRQSDVLSQIGSSADAGAADTNSMPRLAATRMMTRKMTDFIGGPRWMLVWLAGNAALNRYTRAPRVLTDRPAISR